MNKIVILALNPWSILGLLWGTRHCKSQIVVSAKYYSCVTTILMLTQRMQWTGQW